MTRALKGGTRRANFAVQKACAKFLCRQCLMTGCHNYVGILLYEICLEVMASATGVAECLQSLCVTGGLEDKAQGMDELLEQLHRTCKAYGPTVVYEPWQWEQKHAIMVMSLPRDASIFSWFDFRDKRGDDHVLRERSDNDPLPPGYLLCLKRAAQLLQGRLELTSESDLVGIDGERMNITGQEYDQETDTVANQAWQKVRGMLTETNGSLAKLLDLKWSQSCRQRLFVSQLKDKFGVEIPAHEYVKNQPRPQVLQRANAFFQAFEDVSALKLQAICCYRRLVQECCIAGVSASGKTEVLAERLSTTWKRLRDDPDSQQTEEHLDEPPKKVRKRARKNPAKEASPNSRVTPDPSPSSQATRTSSRLRHFSFSQFASDSDDHGQ
eukprot:c18250_g1_i3.p1 GENE.c18250_g1_i3~~c18250_g1_i3.p1  ORF type:complete len:403 (+),score=55.85 c18250_g1_i3:61-1209(+)